MRGPRAVAVAAALLLCVAVPVQAEVDQDGLVRGVFDARLRPTSLPRETAAPVAVRVAGDFRSADGNIDHLPQLVRIAVGINREGTLFDRGLPVCDATSIDPANQGAARRICGDAIVGSGSVVVQIRLSGQAPFAAKARLLAFNGPRRGGRKLIYAQVYARKPPGAFILTFEVSHRSGTFGTVLSTTLPPDTRSWAFLTHFDMTLHRNFVYQGRPRSYVSAACAAPRGFDSVPFPLARAVYGFADGQRLEIPVTRTCRVAAGGER